MTRPMTKDQTAACKRQSLWAEQRKLKTESRFCKHTMCFAGDSCDLKTFGSQSLSRSVTDDGRASHFIINQKSKLKTIIVKINSHSKIIL